MNNKKVIVFYTLQTRKLNDNNLVGENIDDDDLIKSPVNDCDFSLYFLH